ncbi:uncharacterized protein SPSK_08472 [Sporothrix schenckii 1099-18]|nr:uncharacterized protein SPSK_08472 [Sporothrix schenckii 1099-18]KJR84937.1 hypothetical protein SPSK_08472 [Sporothrix schenckii 1099-18]
MPKLNGVGLHETTPVNIDPGGEHIQIQDLSSSNTSREVSLSPELRDCDVPIPSVEHVSPSDRIDPAPPVHRRARALTSASMISGLSELERDSSTVAGQSETPSRDTPSTIMQVLESSFQPEAPAPSAERRATSTSDGQVGNENAPPSLSPQVTVMGQYGPQTMSSRHIMPAPSGGHMRSSSSSATEYGQLHHGQQYMQPNQAGGRRPSYSNQTWSGAEHPNPLVQHLYMQGPGPGPMLNAGMHVTGRGHNTVHARDRHAHVYGTHGYGPDNGSLYPFRRDSSSMSPGTSRYGPPPYNGPFRGFGARTPDVFGPFIDDIVGPAQPVMSLGPFYPRGPEDVPDIMREGSNRYECNNGGITSSVHHRDGTPIADLSPTVGHFDPFFNQSSGRGPIVEIHDDRVDRPRNTSATLLPDQHRNGFMGRAGIVSNGQLPPRSNSHGHHPGSRGSMLPSYNNNNYTSPSPGHLGPHGSLSPNGRVGENACIDPRLLALSPAPQNNSPMDGAPLPSVERARVHAANPNSTTRTSPVSPANRAVRGNSRLGQEVVLASVEEDTDDKADSDGSDKTVKATKDEDDDKESTPRSSSKRGGRDRDDKNGGPGPSGSGPGPGTGGAGAGASGSAPSNSKASDSRYGNKSDQSGNSSTKGPLPGYRGHSSEGCGVHALTADANVAGALVPQVQMDDAASTGSGKESGGSGGGAVSASNAVVAQTAIEQLATDDHIVVTAGCPDPESPMTRPFSNVGGGLADDPFVDHQPRLDEEEYQERKEAFLRRMKHPFFTSDLLQCWLPLSKDSDFAPLEREVYGAMSPTVRCKVLLEERRIRTGRRPSANFDVATIYDETISMIAQRKRENRHYLAVQRYGDYLAAMGECERAGTDMAGISEVVARRGTHAADYLRQEGYHLDIYRGDLDGELRAEYTLNPDHEMHMRNMFQLRNNGNYLGAFGTRLVRKLEVSTEPGERYQFRW